MVHLLMAGLSRDLHSTSLKMNIFIQKVWRSLLPVMTCTNFKEIQEREAVRNLGYGLEAVLTVVCQLCMYAVSIYMI